MQTKLRIVSLLFVVSLLWTSPMSAASEKSRLPKVTQAPRARYVGLASWYGAKHQGRKMANGRKFDRNVLTAACWYFPLGTVVRVVNLRSGNAVTVTITDRGPNQQLHRVLDLSEAAAERLGYIGDGLTPVFISPLMFASPERAKLDSQLIEPVSDEQLTASANVPGNGPN
jgi:rare lipoprotein A